MDKIDRYSLEKYSLPIQGPYTPSEGEIHPHKQSDFSLPVFESGLLLTLQNWSEHQQYLYAIDLFNSQYFWETHEVLEAIWNNVGRGKSTVGPWVQGVILLCASELKKRQGMTKIAEMTHERYRQKVDLLITEQNISTSAVLGISLKQWQADFTEAMAQFLILEIASA